MTFSDNYMMKKIEKKSKKFFALKCRGVVVPSCDQIENKNK